MSNLTKSILGFTFIFFVFLNPSNMYALEQEYESNGQTSFYGEYEYNIEEEDNSSINAGGNTVNGSNNGAEKTRSTNYSETGQNILPNTGDFVNPLYSIIGISTLLGMVSLIYMSRRNEVF